MQVESCCTRKTSRPWSTVIHFHNVMTRNSTIRLLRFYDDVKHLDCVMSRKVLFDDVSRTVYIDWNCSTCDRPLCGSVACMVAILIRERHQYKPQPKKFNFCFHHWWSRLRHEESPHSTYYPRYRHLSITYEEIVFVKWSSVLKIAKNKFCYDRKVCLEEGGMLRRTYRQKPEIIASTSMNTRQKKNVHTSVIDLNHQRWSRCRRGLRQ